MARVMNFFIPLICILGFLSLKVQTAPADVTHTHAYNCRTQALEPLEPFDIYIARGTHNTSQSSPRLSSRDISLADSCTTSSSLLPQFRDLPEDMQLLFKTENDTEVGIPDDEYFEFTASNLNKSETFTWYAGYTIAAQKHPKWNELGETKLFARIFGRSVNFECGPSYKACVEKPSLSQLMDIYPGPELRPLVRRIHFVLHMFETHRQVLNARLVCYHSLLVFKVSLLTSI